MYVSMSVRLYVSKILLLNYTSYFNIICIILYSEYLRNNSSTIGFSNIILIINVNIHVELIESQICFRFIIDALRT